MKSEIDRINIARENLTSAEILFENELHRDAITRYSMYLHLVNKGLVEELYAKYIAKAYLLKELKSFWRNCHESNRRIYLNS